MSNVGSDAKSISFKSNLILLRTVFLLTGLWREFSLVGAGTIDTCQQCMMTLAKKYGGRMVEADAEMPITQLEARAGLVALGEVAKCVKFLYTFLSGFPFGPKCFPGALVRPVTSQFRGPNRDPNCISVFGSSLFILSSTPSGPCQGAEVNN